nr:MAG TPA: hypothetical protein [Caudoviricetes sp.]
MVGLFYDKIIGRNASKHARVFRVLYLACLFVFFKLSVL